MEEKQLTLKEIMSLRKRKQEENPIGDAFQACFVTDPYENASKSLRSIRLPTFVSTETNLMLQHRNIWDGKHAENPERLNSILNRLTDAGLFARCKVSLGKKIKTTKYVELVHQPSLYEELRRLCALSDKKKLEHEASKYDAVYFNSVTLDAALQAISCTLETVKNVSKGYVQNGYALVRPPGHHAMRNEFCGYCLFNNVAIAAEHALMKNWTKKILIVDFDVHHGQGTQEHFIYRNDVLYFSIHRYEHGTFWPNLRESNFDYVGKAKGTGYNINVPLNETGLEDADYIAIILTLLLPIAYEFNPDLIIYSAGYDACLGCPEGCMKITPGLYAHLISLMSGLANGKQVVVLEGGYFIPSLVEAVEQTLKALLGDPCPKLEPFAKINKSTIDTINNVRSEMRKYWKCFSFVNVFEYKEDREWDQFREHLPFVKYFGEVLTPPYETREGYPLHPIEETIKFTNILKTLTPGYHKVKKTVGIAFDELMLHHKSDTAAYERPERLMKIMELINEANLTPYFKFLKVPERNDVIWCQSVHENSYLDKVSMNLLPQSHDLYWNDETPKVAMKAVNALLTVIDEVMQGESGGGVAIIRPPGHHASSDSAQGFCFINNVAVGANYLRRRYFKERVLIIDFDVHHGNGTQDIYYQSNQVMYISIHRFDNGQYYPNKNTAGVEYVGNGMGEGFNINIPFNGSAMGDTEYLAAFHNIILPIAYSFAPDGVIISAGFDAGINDPLGGYRVLPETFGHFITHLKPLANGNVILALEGGYNINTTAYSMLMCIKALIGQPIPFPETVYRDKIKPEAAKVIRDVIEVQRAFWPILEVHKDVADTTVLYHYPRVFKEEDYSVRKYKAVKSCYNHEH